MKYFSPEHRKNLSLAQLGRTAHWKGKKLSEEHKRKISASCKFKKRTLSEETSNKLSDNIKKRILSEETRKKLSENMKKRMASPEARQKMSIINKGNKNAQNHHSPAFDTSLDSNSIKLKEGYK